MSNELRDVITSALTELSDPQTPADNQEEVTTETVDQDEVSTDVVDSPESEVDADTEPEADQADDEESDEVEESEDDADTEDLDKTYTVKIDGEEVQVSLKEALAGYQRQADYTRKLQSLKEDQKQFEANVAEFSDTVESLQNLDRAWDENPIQVLAHFASNTENPTQAVALLIKELASEGLLERQFLEIFGVTPDVQKSWAQEAETTKLRKKAETAETTSKSRLDELEMEAAVQKAVAEYERQIDEILDEEGLDLTVKQRNEFRSQVAGYARDNDITNLKAAYKAMKFEESKAKRELAAKSAERAKAKKTAGVVSRSSSPAGGTAVQDTSDLRSVIEAAMREAQG